MAELTQGAGKCAIEFSFSLSRPEQARPAPPLFVCSWPNIGDRSHKGGTESEKPCERVSVSGKFLQHVYYWLKNFRIIWKMSGCYTEYPDKCKVSRWSGKNPDNLKRVRIIYKMCPVILESSGWSKKCPDNLENVSGWSKKSLDDLEVCLDNLESFRMILKVSG